MKPLYGISEVGNYLFFTYYGHHIKKLGMEQFIYNSCLLYNLAFLGNVDLETDNTLFLVGSQFAIKEKRESEKHV